MAPDAARIGFEAAYYHNTLWRSGFRNSSFFFGFQFLERNGYRKVTPKSILLPPPPKEKDKVTINLSTNHLLRSRLTMGSSGGS